MNRVKIAVSYDGSRFYGSQIQKEKHYRTVNGTLQKALEKLGIHSQIVASGRTDKDVHATHQVIHIDLPPFWNDLKKLKTSLNRLISPDIYIQSIISTDKEFHARFSAKKRLYRYIISTKKFTPFSSKYCLHKENIDVKNLDKIVKKFQGEHNFEYFKKIGSDNKSDIRVIYKSGAYSYKEFIIIYFLGNSFLRSQVRMMVQFSLDVLQEKYTQKELLEQLDKKKKHSTSLVSASGLYLSKIYY